jgi:phosphohistidine phosphatase
MTARIVAEILRIDEQRVQFNHSVYEASPSELLQAVQGTDNRVHRLMLVGHNPGLTTFANFLTGHHLENIPTAGLCGIELLVDKWGKLGENGGKFLYLKTPKSN